MKHTDAVVIGAGPVGLFQVFQLGLQGLACHVIDVLPHAGGQCAELYRDKPIYDIPGIDVCTGHELIQRLMKQLSPFSPQWHFNQQATALERQPEGGFIVQTTLGTRVHTRTVFVASGVGAFMPRVLKLGGLDKFDGTQVFYRLEDSPSAAGQRVIVHGGGEPAVATALACATLPAADRPAQIVLHHRRDAFDAPDAMLQSLREMRAAGRVQVAVGTATGFEASAGVLTSLTVMSPEGEAICLPLDVLCVRLGLVPRLGPIADWGLALERKQLTVDPATCASDIPGIYAVGDAIAYPGKRKLIVSGFYEATLAAFGAAEWLAGAPVALEYTTSSARLQSRLGISSSLG